MAGTRGIWRNNFFGVVDLNENARLKNRADEKEDRLLSKLNLLGFRTFCAFFICRSTRRNPSANTCH